MPYLGNVPSSFNVGTNNIDNDAITTEKIAAGAVVNADVNAAAAIAGTKISPDFGSQNILTTGTSTAASFSPSSSSVPTNGFYLPSANNLAISTNGQSSLLISSTGDVTLARGSLNLNATGGEGGQLSLSNPTNTANTYIFDVDTSANARIFTSQNNTNLSIGQLVGTGGEVRFHTSASERMRLDSSGRLLVGTSSSLSTKYNASSFQPDFQVAATFGAGGFYRYSNNADGPPLVLSKSRSGTVGTQTVVSNGDTVGYLGFAGSDGTAFQTAAVIFAQVDGTPGTNDMPGRLVFSTTADGASSPTERMRLDSSGRLGIGSTAPNTVLDLYRASATDVYITIGNTTTSFLTGVAAGGNYNIYSNNAASIVFTTNASERARIDSSGRLLVGTSSAVTGANASISKLNVIGNSSNSAGNAIAVIGRGAAASTLSTGNDVGAIFFTDNGSNEFAAIACQVDAATGAADAPGRLVFSTTADGASSPTERMRITSGGNVGIGTTSPSDLLHSNGNIRVSWGAFRVATVFDNSFRQGMAFDTANRQLQIFSTTSDTGGSIGFYTRSTAGSSDTDYGTEKAKIDVAGRLLVGTSTAQGQSIFQAVGNSSASTDPGDIRVIRGLNISSIGTNVGAELGIIKFGALENSVCAQISAVCDANWSAGDTPGRLVFSTTADGASSPTERMRITSDGYLNIGRTTTSFSTTGITLYGGTGSVNGAVDAVRSNGYGLAVNRLATDGNLIEFYQDNAIEGTISVSGTTVSYNGAHLSRWSQLPGGAVREEILRGTVLSNIDEMCGWNEEANEQLNRMKVSDVEGDPNVSGVFQAWDDDDDTYTDDFYCAMTGDFIIRIAEDVTVQRGDLLMSAGNGTAKPQDDDIIRSKTIAKVTSTHITCTYDDGSYCVPCVLMAC